MIGDNAWCVSLVYLLKDDVGGVANSASNCSGAMIMERSSLHLNGYCKETDTGNGTLETVPSRLETNAHCSSHAMSHAVADHCAAGLGSTSGLDLRLMFAVPLASDDLCAVCWSHNEILATCCTTGHPRQLSDLQEVQDEEKATHPDLHDLHDLCNTSTFARSWYHGS